MADGRPKKALSHCRDSSTPFRSLNATRLWYQQYIADVRHHRTMALNAL
jgi:hypothetical protein